VINSYLVTNTQEYVCISLVKVSLNMGAIFKSYANSAV